MAPRHGLTPAARRTVVGGQSMSDALRARAEITRRFCERWLRKAARYDSSQLDGAFDKFFTLFVAFNKLYFHTALVSGQPDQGDRAMATRLFPQAIGHELLWQKLVTEGGIADVQTLARLIGPDGSFFLISSADPDTPDLERNANLHRRLLSESPRVAVEAVLEYLYQVRCNMFHGRKGFETRQLQLLRPCLRCLEHIVVAGLERTSSVAQQLGEPGRP